ncbi:protein unc-13 homolog [Aristolochia californica]|uniref:protein unc-13 homolog n=1 Tax=Aristolochia californica TaxID=171875 RepID=UPI0035DB0405
MGLYPRRESITSTSDVLDAELDWPFGKLDAVDRDDLRETAYEVFFKACRSSARFGGTKLSYYHSGAHQDGENSPSAVGSSPGRNGLGLVATSRIKRALGLKPAKLSSPRRSLSTPNSPGNNTTGGGGPTMGSGGGAAGPYATVPIRLKRPLTSAELMRQQMRVSEQSDSRLRKTLVTTLRGQNGPRADTIILPLELLRHLKPSQFNDSHEYHLWQKRQLKTLEAGLLLYPSIPLERSNSSAMHLRDIIRSGELKAIDTGKNSETLRTLCNCVDALSSRGPRGFPTKTCHWADGFPFNLHLYLALLQSIFDLKDETVVLDEVDELIELMKKTWSTLGINQLLHNVCFTWTLFHQFVLTGQTEQDLLVAALTMLADVANDAKRADREFIYMKILSSALTSMQGWAEKRLLDYHDSFHKNASLMENILLLALSAVRILADDVSGNGSAGAQDKEHGSMDSTRNKVDYYVRSSLRNAFAKILEAHNSSGTGEEEEDMSETLTKLCKEIEELATKEKEVFSPIVKKWHPISAGVAAVTLHNCYAVVLKQYLSTVASLSSDVVEVLKTAGKLEKVLVQMVVEESIECEDGGKAIVREMIPYEVDSIIVTLTKSWIEERLKKMRACLNRAKDTETWNPKSKTEPYAQSAVEIMRQAKESVDHFFDIPAGAGIDMIQDLADGLENLLQDYITFVASCGSKQNYMPTLPALTRCNQDSRIIKLWRKASPCRVGVERTTQSASNHGHNPRPSTSRGTQRLYIRLNTLHYLQAHIHSLDKSISLSPRPIQSPRSRYASRRRGLTTGPSYFDLARSSIHTAYQHVSEVAAYRLIFLDSNTVFYESLYAGDVANARIRPALRILKQNFTLLVAILTDRAQPLALKELMKASNEAFLMALLAGGGSRVFLRSDYDMVSEDFANLKRVFCTCGEGLIPEEVVEQEAEVVEGVVGLMGQSTEQLIEDFTIVACEASGIRLEGSSQKVPMPQTTGRWNRTDPNTILRVLCHRNDDAANRFLKRTFQIPKRT